MKKCDIYWSLLYIIFFSVVALLIYKGFFVFYNKEFPYEAGFIQFMVFATSGEMLSMRILFGKWEINSFIIFKAFIWGISGIFVTISFKVNSGGVQLAMIDGMLPFNGNKLAQAFFTSCAANLFFGPVHSAAMRIFDNYGTEKYINKNRLSVYETISSVEWGEFVEFNILKTIPFFWIPINTIIFLLPSSFQIVCAAMLSFVFGMILTLVKYRELKRKKKEESNSAYEII